jgi:hypothetical protein
MGIEPTADSPENDAIRVQGGAESGAFIAPDQPVDPNLAQLVKAWSSLPEPIWAGILAMVAAARG